MRPRDLIRRASLGHVQTTSVGRFRLVVKGCESIWPVACRSRDVARCDDNVSSADRLRRSVAVTVIVCWSCRRVFRIASVVPASNRGLDTTTVRRVELVSKCQSPRFGYLHGDQRKPHCPRPPGTALHLCRSLSRSLCRLRPGRRPRTLLYPRQSWCPR